MVGSVLLAALVAAPHVVLAPDQPLPYIFAGEPLIVQLTDDVGGAIPFALAYTSPGEPPIADELGALELLPGRPRWVTHSLPPERYGPHTVVLRGGDVEFVQTITRVRRPVAKRPPPVILRVPSEPGPWVQLTRILPVRAVELAADHPNFQELAQGFHDERVPIRLITNAEGSLDALDIASDVLIPLGGSAADWLRVANRVAQAAPDARIVLRGASGQELTALLRDGGAGRLHEIEAENVDGMLALRDAAERLGYEAMTFSVGPVRGAGFHGMTTALNEGASHAVLEGARLLDAHGLTDLFGETSAFLHLLDGYTPAGERKSATLFRPLAVEEDQPWIAVLPDDADSNGMFPTAAAFDAFGNGAARPDELADPAYAAGKNKGPLSKALAGAISREADFLANLPGLERWRNDATTAALNRLRAASGGDSLRSEFFVLLRALPELEAGWHGGRYRRAAAVPAMASIERAVRRIGALEELLNARFMEPLEETLNRCGEQQTRYLTAAGGASAMNERGEWLFQHVSALMLEARRVHGEGRTIEGNALAALAEWRARALIHAAKAGPLAVAEPDPPERSP